MINLFQATKFIVICYTAQKASCFQFSAITVCYEHHMQLSIENMPSFTFGKYLGVG